MAIHFKVVKHCKYLFVKYCVNPTSVYSRSLLSDLQRTGRIAESLDPPAANMLKHLKPNALPKTYLQILLMELFWDEQVEAICILATPASCNCSGFEEGRSKCQQCRPTPPKPVCGSCWDNNLISWIDWSNTFLRPLTVTPNWSSVYEAAPRFKSQTRGACTICLHFYFRRIQDWCPNPHHAAARPAGSQHTEAADGSPTQPVRTNLLLPTRTANWLALSTNLHLQDRSHVTALTAVKMDT